MLTFQIRLEKRSSMKGEKSIFISYSEQSKAYRLCNSSTNNFLISRDVILMKQILGDEKMNKSPLHISLNKQMILLCQESSRTRSNESSDSTLQKMRFLWEIYDTRDVASLLVNHKILKMQLKWKDEKK